MGRALRPVMMKLPPGLYGAASNVYAHHLFVAFLDYIGYPDKGILTVFDCSDQIRSGLLDIAVVEQCLNKAFWDVMMETHRGFGLDETQCAFRIYRSRKYHGFP